MVGGFSCLFALLPAVAQTGEGATVLIHLEIQDRQVQLESDVLRVTQGQTVNLVWNSDEAGKLHLHGYDIEFEVSPDEPTIVTFRARATGRFPVTSHGFGGDPGHGHDAMMYIEVYPD
jgi:hypothetical protein